VRMLSKIFVIWDINSLPVVITDICPEKDIKSADCFYP